MNLTAFATGEAMLVDIAANGVVNEKVVELRLDAVMEVTTDGFPVNTSGLCVISFRHFVGLVLLNDRFLKVAILSELAVAEVDAEAILPVIPILWNGGIEGGGLPGEISSESDLGDGFPFMVSGWSQLEVGQTIIYLHGSDVTVRCDERRRATGDMRGLLVDGDSVEFHLNGGEDSLTKGHGGHLVPDTDAFTKVSTDDSSKGAEASG